MEYILLFEQFIPNEDDLSGKPVSNTTINKFKFSKNGTLLTDRIIVTDKNDEFYNKKGTIIGFHVPNFYKKYGRFTKYTEWIIKLDNIEGEISYLDNQFELIKY